MKTLTLLTLSFLACVPPASAQVYLEYPGDPAGLVSAQGYPFGQSSPQTLDYVSHVPAAALDPANPFIRDVAVWTNTVSGVWTSPDVTVAIGHVPTPTPCSFVFPTAGGATIGSFSDLTVLWDASVDGPLSLTVTGNQWSPLGLPASGRAPFQWNGIDAIGVFIGRASHTGTGSTQLTVSPLARRSYDDGTGAPVCDAVNGIFLRLELGCAGAPWQVNQPTASLDFNGLSNSPCEPILLETCTGMVNTLNLGSTQLGLPYDIAITSSPGVPVGGGGLLLPGGDVVNINLADPSLTFVFGFTWTENFVAPVSVPVAAAASVSIQMVTTDPAAPLGFALSALNRQEVVTPVASVTFNLGLDGYTELNLANPLCSGPVSFYGTTYTSLFVNANGFVSFTGGDSLWTAGPSLWAAGPPRIGVWSDFNSAQGSITASLNGTRTIVSYSVPEAVLFPVGPPVLTNFNIEFDTLSGAAAITGFAGDPGHGTDTLIGITPGNGAADPGSTSFANFLGLGPQGGPGGNVMLYEYVGGGMPQGYPNLAFPGGDSSSFVVF